MDNPVIGDLRSRVTLGNQVQSAQIFGTGIDVVMSDQRQVWANITPVGTAVYLAGVQADIDDITHRIVIRYADDLDEFQMIIRDRVRPDGTINREVYRVVRKSEINGRERFLMLEVNLQGPNI